jgi:hypothetical protein
VPPPDQPTAGLLPLLQRIRDALPEGSVSVGWLYLKFEEGGPHALLLFLGLLGVVPGADTPSGIAIFFLGLLMLKRKKIDLPARVATHRLGRRSVRYALSGVIDLLSFVEHHAPDIHPAGHARPHPLAALLVAVLGAAMLVPIPLSNVAPSLAVAMIALALLEGSVYLFLAAWTWTMFALGFTAWFVVLVVRGFGCTY